MLSARVLALFAVAAVASGACYAELPLEPAVPATSASAQASAAPPAPSASSKAYAGHGAESVSLEVIAKFAAPPLNPDVSERIQSMLDVRAPGSGRLSEDGKHLYFSWSVTGTRQIWRIDGPQRFPVQVTGGEATSSLATIAPDDSFVLIQRDRNGEENPGLYLQKPEGGALNEIQRKKGVQTFFEFVSDDSKWVYFRANDIKPASFAVYRWERSSGKREVVFDEDGLWSVADHQPDGHLLLEKALGSNQSEFWEFDPATKKTSPIIGQGEREDYVVKYAAQKGEFLVQTPKLGEFRRLYRLKGKELTAVTPEMKHDVEDFAIDEGRTRILYQVNDEGFTRLRALDARTYKEITLPKLPAADHVVVASQTKNGRFITLSVSTSKAPPASYVLDWNARTVTQWHTPSAPEIDTSRFAEAKLESYPARDGTKIPMFVRRPQSCEEPCPVIVEFHGGPEAQARPGFSTYAQIFVDAGFVFVEPNVRGSDGYGKTWIHADDGPKRLSVITDIEDAAKYVRSAWAKNGKAPKVGIFGGSYGGYSTLIGMTMFAGAYDAGVEIVGMSNLYTFLMNTAPYRRSLRISEYGDPDKDKEALLKLSPITYVDRVKAPLLLIQGASDPRVPVGEAIQIHEALDKKGIDNKLIVFADEGHGAQKRGNQVLQLGHALRFFEQYLKPDKSGAKAPSGSEPAKH